LDIVLVLVLSLYFLVAGPRLVHWLHRNAPIKQRGRLTTLLSTLEQVVGGYIRGQLILSTTIGTFGGGGMFVLHVPYAVLLGLLAFLLEFIPTLGTLSSGVVCVLVALTQGWVLALVVLAYFVVIHLLEGYVLAPRVLAQAVGLHPAVSIIALLVGAEVLGVWGALFAAPLAGVFQVLLAALWLEWRQAHQQQFPEEFGPLVVPVMTPNTLVPAPAARETVASAAVPTEGGGAVL
jgi:predicted PurR-regulated permease PerM